VVTMHSSRMMFLGAVFAGLGVAAGAFGAHMLKPVLDTTLLGVFETAVRYQMYHALALCLLGAIGDRYPQSRVATVGWLFVIGVGLFSGSLYVLALSGIRWMGAFTPLGGMALIAGWALWAWTVATKRP
jgi:uncharacterized membrane protein YgdD (TMEM256/DUF423 family)